MITTRLSPSRPPKLANLGTTCTLYKQISMKLDSKSRGKGLTMNQIQKTEEGVNGSKKMRGQMKINSHEQRKGARRMKKLGKQNSRDGEERGKGGD